MSTFLGQIYLTCKTGVGALGTLADGVQVGVESLIDFTKTGFDAATSELNLYCERLKVEQSIANAELNAYIINIGNTIELFKETVKEKKNLKKEAEKHLAKHPNNTDMQEFLVKIEEEIRFLESNYIIARNILLDLNNKYELLNQNNSLNEKSEAIKTKIAKSYLYRATSVLADALGVDIEDSYKSIKSDMEKIKKQNEFVSKLLEDDNKKNNKK